MHYTRLLPLQIQHTCTLFGKDIPSSFFKSTTTEEYALEPLAISHRSDLFVPGQKYDNALGFFWKTYLYDFFKLNLSFVKEKSLKKQEMFE